ncbi:MAG TPA: agmatinase [Dehalococcoidia bacterium]|nr:agmatinase [Dehalococcoidia bacterium]
MLPKDGPDASYPLIPHNFLALPHDQSALESSRVAIIPVPYDSTTSFRSGSRDGPEAMITASYGLEDYDFELELDVSEIGIHTTGAIEPHMAGPGPMTERIKSVVGDYLTMGKTIGLLGGEHSITIGSVQAHVETYPDLSVLYLDAHADLRNEYMGTPYGHASAARRAYECCPIALAGIRSMCQEEHDFIRENNIPVWYWDPNSLNSSWESILDILSGSVYVSVDLDVLDPALLPAVGTPEPGGLAWHQLVSLLDKVAESRRIVGFDVCELAPADGPPACSYTAAKLVYKLVAYACGNKNQPS